MPTFNPNMGDQEAYNKLAKSREASAEAVAKAKQMNLDQAKEMEARRRGITDDQSDALSGTNDQDKISDAA